MEVTPEIQAATREGMERVVRDLPRPHDQLAAARYLASMAWLSTASMIADEIVVNYRNEHPGQTYSETAADLRTHPSTVNRAIVRYNRAGRAA